MQEIYQGFVKDYDFSGMISGANSGATYSVELASDASGNPITAADLETELTASIPTPGTSTVRFDATKVKLADTTQNSSIYYRLTLHQSDNTRVNSVWTALTIR